MGEIDNMNKTEFEKKWMGLLGRTCNSDSTGYNKYG